jgi:hypothetical protein
LAGQGKIREKRQKDETKEGEKKAQNITIIIERKRVDPLQGLSILSDDFVSRIWRRCIPRVETGEVRYKYNEDAPQKGHAKGNLQNSHLSYRLINLFELRSPK